MKKALFIIFILVFVFAIPVSAAVVIESYERVFVRSFTESPASNVSFGYYSGGNGYLGASAATVQVVPAGTVGRSFAFIRCWNDSLDLDEARSNTSSQIVDGAISCETYLNGSAYATKVNFMAARTISGEYNAWDITYYDPDVHGEEMEEEEDYWSVTTPVEVVSE